MLEGTAALRRIDSESGDLDKSANHCFGCGKANPQGLQLEFEVAQDEAGLITATCLLTLTRIHEGSPGFLHGGIIATLLDEAMCKLNGLLAIFAVTRSLSVDYLRPAPVLVPLRLVGTHVKRNGRKVFHSAKLQAEDGTVLARGEGLFVVVDRTKLSGKQKDSFASSDSGRI